MDPDEAFYAGSDESFLHVGKGTADCFRQLLHATRQPVVLEGREGR